MLTPAAKRRRVEQANQALRKPFRSPMLNKQPARTADDASPSKLKQQQQQQDRAPIVSVDGEKPDQPEAQVSTITSNSSPHRVHKKTNRAVSPEPGSGEDHPFAGILFMGTKQQRALDRASRELDQQLEMVRQARRIETESQKKRPGEEIDAELKQLIPKWKGATRLAAEEMFEIVKQRITSMGGVKAWKEMQRRQSNYFRELDEEQDMEQLRKRRESGNDPECHQESDEAISSDVRNYEAQREDEAKGDSEDENEFTMKMMLESLNVDPGTVGYDAKEERWLDSTGAI